MYKEILNPEQIKLLSLLKEFKRDFYLAGGTAIALQIGHRRSIDYDLFSEKELDTLRIIRIIKKAGFSIDATIAESIEELTLVINRVKVTFLQYPFKIGCPLSLDDIITMPDLLTLSAMKAFSLGKRSKWKDYIDLYFILKHYYSISDISKRAKELFKDGFNERLFREQLCYFEDIDFSESIDFVTEPVKEEAIKDFLIEVSTAL